MLGELFLVVGLMALGAIPGYFFGRESKEEAKTKAIENSPIDVEYFINLIKSGYVIYDTFDAGNNVKNPYMKSPDGKFSFTVCPGQNETYNAAKDTNFYLFIDGKTEYYNLNYNDRKRILAEMMKFQKSSINDRITEFQLKQAKDFIEKHTQEISPAQNTNTETVKKL